MHTRSISRRFLTVVVWAAGTMLATAPCRAGGPTRSFRDRSLVEPPQAEDFGAGASGPRSTANVKHFGARGDGLHDDTAAVQAAIDSLAAQGGIVIFPGGRFRIDGQLVLPNDGASTDTRQPPYAFQGVGALFDGRAGEPRGGSVLDLRYAGGAKIATHGLGLLEFERLTFADFGNDDQPFLYTTNTTLHVHDCGFYGTRQGASARNDAIVLGGTNGVGTGGDDPNAPFQGYATVIRDNYFGRIRRALYGRVFANGVAVYGNTVWSNCGSDLPDGAAIELDGDPDDMTVQVNAGWHVAGNLIEMTNYAYGIKTRQSQRNAFIANNFYDPGDVTLAYYRFEETGRMNYVVAGFHDDAIAFVDDRATGNWRSTVINFHQDQESAYAQKVRFLNRLYLEPGQPSPYGPRLISPSGTELTYQLLDDSGVAFSYTPAGGSPVSLWQVTDLGGGSVVQDLKGTDARIRNLNGAVGIYSQAGAPAELGDTNGRGIRVEAGKVELTPTSVQILSGSGPPGNAAPNGSIYLRTDGGTGSTLYVRESGVWVAK